MKLLFLKSLRTIRFNKIRYLGALLLIILSSALFTTFRTSGYSIRNSLNNFFIEHNLADVSFEVANHSDTNGLRSEDRELLNQYFDQTEKRYYWDYKRNGATLRLFSITQNLNTYQLKQGQIPQAPDEILLDQSFADYHDIKINETININAREAKITGFFALPDYITVTAKQSNVVNDSDAFGLVLVNDISYWTSNYKTEYLAKLSGQYDQTQKDRIFLDFKKALQNRGYTPINWLEANLNVRITSAQGDISGFIEIGQILPIFILLVASFMLAIILNRQLLGEENIMGTLYAVGYAKKELLIHYLFLPFLLIVSGALLGGFLGYFCARFIALIELSRYNLPLIVYTYNPLDLLIILGIAFGMILPVMFFVTLNALRQPPLELMRGRGRRAKVSRIEKTARIENLKFGLKFYIRDILRNFGRHMIMFFGMAISGMLLMIGLGLLDSVNNIDKDIKKTYKSQHIYTFESEIKYDNYLGGETYFEAIALIYNEDNFLKTILRFVDEDFGGVIQRDKKTKQKIDYSDIVVSYSAAKHLGIKTGDEIRIVHKSLPFEDWEYKVKAISDYVLGDVIFLPKSVLIEEFNETYYTDYENIYNTVISDTELDLEQADYINIYDYLSDTIGQVLGALIAAIFIIGVSAVLVAVVLVYIIVDLVLEENKYNIALFKMFGYSSNKVNSLILNGGILFAAAGLALSYPLDLLFIGYILSQFTQGMSLMVNPVISWLAALTAFLTAAAVYGLSRALAAKRIATVPIGEALKNNEQ
jgi:putative ABC transport system permease protein